MRLNFLSPLSDFTILPLKRSEIELIEAFHRGCSECSLWGGMMRRRDRARRLLAPVKRCEQ